MRTSWDRLRHALLFEIIGILLVTPLAMLVLGMSLEHAGVVAVGSALIAMLWNYVYNWGFDTVMLRRTGNTLKGPLLRIFHAALFEIGLLIVLAPFIAWWLGVSLWAAVLLDIGFAAFYMGYAYVFNWGYDRIFPLPEWQEAG